MTQEFRVRFAPSPTGYLHVGGARTALFNWLAARRLGGVFALRIEDTDVARSSDEMTGIILDGLRWLGIEWDGDPLHQSSRRAAHEGVAQQLLDSGHAYRCLCPPEPPHESGGGGGDKTRSGAPTRRYRACLDWSDSQKADSESQNGPGVIRFKVPEGSTTYSDTVHGELTVNHEQIDDFVILRSDGSPTYQIAVVADDHEMGISDVIRGDDHLSNTPKQILLYEALGWEVPNFAHLPLILGPDRARLSKRHGAVSVLEYRETGFMPSALVNYLALLGWSPGDDREIMTVDELIQNFSLDRVSSSNPIFDETKCRHVNAQHIMALSDSDFGGLIRPLIDKAGFPVDRSVHTDHWFLRLAAAVKERTQVLSEVPSAVDYFFIEPDSYDEKGLKKHVKPGMTERLTALIERLNDLEPWTAESLEATVRDLAAELEVSAAKLIHPTRLALSGRTFGPGLFDIMLLLGREACVRRMKNFLEKIGNPDG